MSIESIKLPEFGLTFSWAMCRNVMCDHFGIPYTGEFPTGVIRATTDDYYRLEQNGRLRCKYCGLSFEIKSNKAVRPIARYFLSLSLPFADCPDTTCTNHGYNVFEHYIEGDSPYRSQRRYSKAAGDYRVTCIECQERFSIGEPLRLRGKQDLSKTLKYIIQEVLKQGTITNTLEWDEKLSVSAYYRALQQVATRLRDYQSWRNARLLDPGVNVDRQTPARVYTDVIQVTMRRLGEGPRHQFLNIIVSVLALEKSGFILAAHPAFLPKEHAPENSNLINSTQPGEPGLTDDWDCLWHHGQIDPATIDDDEVSLPDIGRGGFFIRSPYVEAAHFLVVQKMLSRFDKVYYYMDAARDLYPAALCALARSVRTGQVEIALFQHDKKPRTQGVVAHDIKRYTDTGKENLLVMAFDAMEARFDEEAVPKHELPLTSENDNKLRAGLFRRAFKGGYSKTGRWAWLTYPPDSGNYHNCCSLWLTRSPEKSFEVDGVPLLLHATLQPVDSIMNSMRSRVRALSRASSRARPGRSFQGSYTKVDAVLGELWVYLMQRNHRLRKRTKQKKIPAHALGLMTEKQAVKTTQSRPAEHLSKIVMDFRLGLPQAGRMSRWHR